MKWGLLTTAVALVSVRTAAAASVLDELKELESVQQGISDGNCEALAAARASLRMYETGAESAPVPRIARALAKRARERQRALKCLLPQGDNGNPNPTTAKDQTPGEPLPPQPGPALASRPECAYVNGSQRAACDHYISAGHLVADIQDVCKSRSWTRESCVIARRVAAAELVERVIEVLRWAPPTSDMWRQARRRLSLAAVDAGEASELVDAILTRAENGELEVEEARQLLLAPTERLLLASDLVRPENATKARVFVEWIQKAFPDLPEPETDSNATDWMTAFRLLKRLHGEQWRVVREEGAKLGIWDPRLDPLRRDDFLTIVIATERVHASAAPFTRALEDALKAMNADAGAPKEIVSADGADIAEQVTSEWDRLTDKGNALVASRCEKECVKLRNSMLASHAGMLVLVLFEMGTAIQVDGAWRVRKEGKTHTLGQLQRLTTFESAPEPADEELAIAQRDAASRLVAHLVDEHSLFPSVKLMFDWARENPCRHADPGLRPEFCDGWVPSSSQSGRYPAAALVFSGLPFIIADRPPDKLELAGATLDAALLTSSTLAFIVSVDAHNGGSPTTADVALKVGVASAVGVLLTRLAVVVYESIQGSDAMP